VTREKSERYIDDANYFLQNDQIDNAVSAIRKAIVEDPKNPRAHHQSLLIHRIVNRNDHAVLHGIFAKKWISYPDRWLYLALDAISLYHLSIEHHHLGDRDASELLFKAVESFEEAYNDNPEMVRQRFSSFVFLIEGVATLQKIKVDYNGPIPFSMYSSIQDFCSSINLKTLVKHLQNKINKYGSLIPYIIEDIQTGAVGRYHPCNQVDKWEPNSSRGTLATRMMNETSNGGILLIGPEGPLLIDHIIRVYESFMPVKFEPMHPHSSITFIEAQDKRNQILRYALLDPVTFYENNFSDVFTHYLYIHKEESKNGVK
jgi:tetratricopeptide (TPR) repeat protein